MIRLYGVTFPPLDVSHNWRQTTVTMVARNFQEIDNNILYPRIDNAGELTGITGMEFPVFNYIIYLLSLIFGYTHWYGRLINLVVSSVGLWYFYLVIKKYFTEKHAFYATFSLLNTLWFTYSRMIMPDTFSTALIIISIYYGCEYFDQKKNIKNLLLYFLFALLGALSKLPAAYLLSIFALFVFSKQYALNKKIIFCSISLLLITPVAWWYFYWSPMLVTKYEFFHFFLGSPIVKAAQELVIHFADVLYRFYDNAMKYLGFTCYVIGFVLIVRHKNKRLLGVFIMASLSFLLVMLKSGWVFAHHNYYIIPFIPVMSLLVGYFLAHIEHHKFAILIPIALVIECISGRFHEFRIHEKYNDLLTIEAELDKVGQRSDLIAINCGPSPASLYASHRKGWNLSNKELTTDKIKELKSKGCQYIVILKRVFGTDKQFDLKEIVNNYNFRIYKL